MEVSNIETIGESLNEKKKDDIESNVRLPLTDDMLSNLQSQDTFCSNILAQIEKGNIKEGQIYIVQNKLLK